MTEKIVRHYGGCEVTLVFGENNPELKDKVLGLLLENYQERISDELSAEYRNAAGKRKAS